VKNKYKIPFLFFILVYANQGISSLPGDCIYYLTRESWLLTASQIGMIGFIIGIPWCIKIFWGALIDYFPIKGYRAKYYLYFNYVATLLVYLYIIVYGFNFWSLIISGFLINCFIALSDTANDSQMVILEQKYKLQGKLQSLQWSSLAIAGLAVSLGGAFIAQYFPEPFNYKIAYGLAGIIPLITLIYLFKSYKEKPIIERKNPKKILEDLKKILDPKLLFALLFIACFQLCPSFGTALKIKMREELMIGKLFIGVLGATGTVLGLIGYALYYWKFHKCNMRKLLYFMVVFSALTNLFYLYLPNKWFIVGYNIAFGAFGGITFMTLLSYFANLVPKGSEGMIYAFITSLSNLCARAGSWIGGVIFDHWGYSTNVIISTILTLCCVFIIKHLTLDKLDNHVV